MMRRGTDAIAGFNARPGGFYINCLSALDAATHFVKPESFVSYAAFVAELRRLMIEPTEPSRPVQSVAEYQRAQRHWLEQVIIKRGLRN